MSIDEVDYGLTKGIATATKDRVDKIEPEVKSMSRKIDLLLLLVGLNLIGGIGTSIYNGEAKQIMTSVKDLIIFNADAYDNSSITEHAK